jgi:hypothetical protein
VIGPQQDFHAAAQGMVTGAGLVQEGGPLAGRFLPSQVKECLFVHGDSLQGRFVFLPTKRKMV